MAEKFPSLQEEERPVSTSEERSSRRPGGRVASLHAKASTTSEADKHTGYGRGIRSVASNHTQGCLSPSFLARPGTHVVVRYSTPRPWLLPPLRVLDWVGGQVLYPLRVLDLGWRTRERGVSRRRTGTGRAAKTNRSRYKHSSTARRLLRLGRHANVMVNSSFSFLQRRAATCDAVTYVGAGT